MTRCFLPLFLLAIALPLAAAPATRDFAWQAPLDAAEQPLQRVALPLDVLLVLTRADFGDLAVFNAEGKPLPHSVLKTPPTEMPMTRELPFHEFSRYRQQHSRTVTLREQNLEPGTVTEREMTETLPVRVERRDYLIELAAGDEQIAFDRLQLEWRHQPATQLLELRVEAGSELDELRLVDARKSLTDRESNDPGWRSIEGIPATAKYLRLRPLDSIDSFELLRVNGHYTESIPAPQLVDEATVESFADETGSYYRVELPAAVKPEAMRIVPAADHGVVVGDLYALWEGLPDKRLVRANFRQHNIAGDEVRPSQPIGLPGRDLSEIRFSSKSALAAAPRVELLYPQYEVVFLGDSNPPYRLAWGNRDSPAPAFGLFELLDDDVDVHQRSRLVGLGDPQPAGGPARLEAPTSLPWLKWLLWVLLVAAVGVTGRMAIRLYREMNRADPA
jgi:hypothetical protein